MVGKGGLMISHLLVDGPKSRTGVRFQSQVRQFLGYPQLMLYTGYGLVRVAQIGMNVAQVSVGRRFRRGLEEIGKQTSWNN